MLIPVLVRAGLSKGLNHVNRQPSKKVIFQRRSSKFQVNINRKKVSSYFQLIVMDFWPLKESLNMKN